MSILLHQLGHRAVGGRRGEDDRRAVLLDPLQEMRRRGLFEQQRGGADAQREEQDAAEPEGEGERRRAAEDVVPLGFRT